VRERDSRARSRGRVRAAVNDDFEADAVDFELEKKVLTRAFLTRHSRAPAIACARGNGCANDPTRVARDFGARGARAATTRE